MNRNQLRYFVAAAESRSFTKAADQFFISQTAVTQQIRLLEEMLGCPLFDRSTRPVSLTPAGKAFLTEAKAILERMDQAIDRAHGASTGLSGSLRIGYLKGYEQSGFTDFLREFHQRHANLLITFYRCTTDQLADIGTYCNTSLSYQLDTVFRNSRYRRSINHFRVYRHLYSFEYVTSCQVDSGCHLEREVNIRFRCGNEGMDNLFDMSACQVVCFQFVTGQRFQTCFVGFDHSRNDDIRRNVTYTH